ncbi:MAG: molybdenum cofactor biosynthesis protein MoaE [Planctomycetota bacterium]
MTATTRIIDGPLPPIDPHAPHDGAVGRARAGDAGAELIFHGRVRGTEATKGTDGGDTVPIVALDYEQYEGMTAAELQQLADETATRFPLLAFECLHRVGRVPVGEASLRVTLISAHRGEAIDALTWFVNELKVRVPIWKWGVRADGSRFPS